MDDMITNLLRDVAKGKVSVEDARLALEDATLTEEQLESAIEKGVFEEADMGAVVSATLAPSGGSYLTMFFFVWGIFWACYWIFSLIYGLAKDWDQRQLSFHLAMGITTLIFMGLVYLKFILPDTIIVKNAINKFIPEHQKDWKEYKW
ncbi:MAG: hypothetical protein ISR22_03180 [Candidatus Poseidoniaceae archaeon]|jgi:hypothetical protein|nr:hypothetical protein [Euryarchaeota archaeon]MBL6891034.1 hypothetical protein [Candidatus Poseidoniaceae archaeon]RAH06238.1 MAG: hypothetical protein CBC92_004095 [Euryarchaeota archaeon TMED132]|tara:strand:- start:2834 stop:3277 length:444 start_codon:yes stop_codon:yes gene_type:complete